MARLSAVVDVLESGPTYAKPLIAWVAAMPAAAALAEVVVGASTTALVTVIVVAAAREVPGFLLIFAVPRHLFVLVGSVTSTLAALLLLHAFNLLAALGCKDLASCCFRVGCPVSAALMDACTHCVFPGATALQ